MTAPEFALSKYASRDDMHSDMHSDMLTTIHSLRQQLAAAQCVGCAVKESSHKPAEALHTIGEPEATHLRELNAYRTTVQNLEAELAALKAAPAAQAVEPTEQQILDAASKAGLMPNSVHSWIPAFKRYHAALRATPPAPAAVAVPGADYAARFKAQHDFLNWNRAQQHPPVKIAQEYGVFNNALYLYQAALAATPAAQAVEVERTIAIDMKQATALLDLFGGEPTEFTVMQCAHGHSGQGLYAYVTEYPEDGAIFLGKTDCDATPAPQAQDVQRDALTQAARDVLAERARQISAEGWAPERDDSYSESEMALAAASYACAAGGYAKGQVPPIWPWTLEWWKPTYGRRDLEKAGALILAEMERIDRAAIAASAAKGGEA